MSKSKQSIDQTIDPEPRIGIRLKEFPNARFGQFGTEPFGNRIGVNHHGHPSLGVVDLCHKRVGFARQG